MPMKTSWCSLLSLVALAGLAACSAAPVVPGARPADCALEFLYKAPSRPYEPLGDLRMHVTRVPPGGAVEALRPKACALGADAVIVTRNQVVNLLDHALVEGTAIRYGRAAPPALEPAPSPPQPSQGPPSTPSATPSQASPPASNPAPSPEAPPAPSAAPQEPPPASNATP